MTETTFTPYWRRLGSATGPNSWFFFVVAKVGGRHRPVAAVSSIGGAEEESLHGTPLVGCCQRIVTILSDPANRTAIGSELALAAAYYARNGASPEPVELPKLTRKHPGDPARWRPWDSSMVSPFPFITASLLQGVGFRPPGGRSAPNRPEPLATVYRDTDIEWGMVVFDITDLNMVRYGIVGFSVGMAKFIPSREADVIPFQGASFQPEEGPLRVVDEVRPRAAMSAAEYMAKFKYEEEGSHGDIMERLTSIPLVEGTAMSLVWPSDESPSDDLYPSETDLSVNTRKWPTLQDQTIRTIIRHSSHIDDLDISMFDEVYSLPGFKDSLRQNLLEHSDRVGSTRSSGQLFRLAFAQNGHLGLEQLESLSAECISAALENRSEIGDSITSLGLCINSVRSAPAQLADAISQAKALREICLHQNPTPDSDVLSVQLFAELAARPDILSRTNVMFAGAYSAALRKRFWLPTRSSLTPKDIFPVQQILVKHQRSSGRRIESHYDCVHLADGLLKPERFAVGFLLWLSALEWKQEWMFEETAPFFSFSSAPASLGADPLSASQVSPILCENLSLPFYMPDQTICSPRTRDLIPEGGWTVLVSQEKTPGAGVKEQYCVRYALVRALDRPTRVDEPPTYPLKPEELEVVGLKEFLSITAPEVDPVIVNQRLKDTAEKIVTMSTAWGLSWPIGVEPLSVLSQVEAATLLVELLEDAKMRNKRFQKATEEDPEGESTVLPVLTCQWSSY